VTVARRGRRRCPHPTSGSLLRIIDSPTTPLVRPGWQVAPLRGLPDARWLAWDDRVLRVVIVIEIAGPDLCTALWKCGFTRAAASATFEIWAAIRS
jgi:hypothetical protein